MKRTITYADKKNTLAGRYADRVRYTTISAVVRTAKILPRFRGVKEQIASPFELGVSSCEIWGFLIAEP